MSYTVPASIPASYMYGWTSFMDGGNQTEPEIRFAIPALPILGAKTPSQLIRDLCKSIRDEAEAADFYTRLLQQTTNPLFKKFITHARNEELQHLRMFTQLYVYLTGQQPRYTITPVRIETFREGILRAFQDELKAAEFYRNTAFSVTDPMIRDAFLYARTAEMEHAARFSFVYPQVK